MNSDNTVDDKSVIRPGVTVVMEFRVKLANGKEVDSSVRSGGLNIILG